MAKMAPTASFSRRVRCCALLLIGGCALGESHSSAFELPQESSQQGGAALTLVPGSFVDREFAGGATHSYQIALSAGEFIRALLAQKGAEVAVTLIGPDGQQLARFDESIGWELSREILFVAKSDGNDRFLVNPLQEDAGEVRYQIRLETVRPATEEDRIRVRATQIVKDARQAFWSVRPLTAEETARFTRMFEEALQLWQELDDKWMIGEGLLDLGILSGKQGEFTRALELYERALPLFPQTPEGVASKGTTLNNVADIYYRLGETRKALETHLKSLELKKAGKSRAITLDNLGGVYLRLGEYQLALDHHQQALTLFREMKAVRDEAVALNNLATVLGSLGDLDRSLEYLLQALALIREIGDKNEEAVNLYNAGFCCLRMGDNRQALEYATQCINLSRTIGNHRSEADALTLLCNIYQSLGEHDKGLDACNRALAMHRKSGDRPTEALTQAALSKLHEQTRQMQKAVESREAALGLFRAIGDPKGELNTLHALGRLAMDRGDLVTARRQIEQAIEMTESVRIKVGSHQLRYTYMAGLQQVYESYVDLLMQLHGQQPGRGYEQTALQFSERARARSLLDLLAEARAQIRQGADSVTLEEERSLLERLSAKDAAWKRLRNNQRMKSQAESIGNEINDLTTRLQLVEAKIRSSSPRYAELTQPHSLTLPEIQEQVLDNETVLLEFALGEKRSWLWAVTATGISTYQLPPRPEIELAARTVYELLTARQPRKDESEDEWHRRVAAADRRFPDEAASLSQILLGPVSGNLGQEWKGKRLLIVAGGALEYVPFAALPVPSADSTFQPLIAAHEIVNLPSASVLSVIRRETAGRRSATRSVAVLADPVFGANDPRVVQAKKRRRDTREIAVNTQSTSEAGRMHSDLIRSVRSVDREDLSRLPFSREEAEAIASLVPARSLLKMTDFQASRVKAASGELSNYRVVHFATHGLLNSEHPELSGLVLSLVDETGRAQEGFLRVHEIYNLKLPADVVVLSACQTGLGREIKGEGLIGLTRGFMYAGAQRVVASLWQVDDLATARLMERFYRGMLKDGMRPAAALRAAQLEMTKQKRWSMPYFWAAFVMQGEWK